MTDKSRLLELATQLADGQALDTEDAIQELDKLKIVADIAAAYRSVRDTDFTDDEDERKPLFQWGHLQVLEKIDEGAFGKVFRAYDPVLDREVALKLRHSEQNTTTNSRAFIQEARRLARVRHPNVLAVHGADVHDGSVGLWADLLDGATLEQKLQQKESLQIQVVLAIAIAQDLMLALMAVHEVGLVHGDVKASNIMLGADGHAVLMDFGAGSDIQHNQTMSTTVGTPLIMAPEVLTGAASTPAADLYSLGVLLFRLLAGQYPYQAKTTDELCAQHEKNTRSSLRKQMSGVPRALASLVDSLLDINPEQRPNATAALDRIHWILNTPVRRRWYAAIGFIIASLSIGIILSTWGYLDAHRAEQQALSAKQEAEAVNIFMADILTSARPNVSGKNTLVTEVLATAAERLQSALSKQPLARAQASHHIGKSYLEMNVPEQALPLLQQAYELRSRHLGAQHPDTLWTQASLGKAMFWLRRFEEAKQLLLTGAEISNQLPDDNLKVEFASALGGFYSHINDQHQSVLYTKAALSLVNPKLDPLNYHNLRKKLALTLNNQGYFSEAVPILLNSLDWAEQHQPRSGLTLYLRQGLASAWGQSGQLTEAETLIRSNLQQATTWLGSKDPFIIQSLSLLSNILNAQKRVKEAMVINSKALALSREVNGENSWFTLRLMGNQAIRHHDMRQNDTAKALYLDAIKRVNEAYYPSHSLGHHPRINLTALYLEQGDYNAGLTLAEQTLPILQKERGSFHYLTIKLRYLYGTLLFHTGDIQPAKQELQDALKLAKEHLSDDHEVTADTITVLKKISPVSAD